MPHYASIADFRANASPTAAEDALIDACQAGKSCRLGTLPEDTPDAPTIRADLLRLLITGGTPACGLQYAGVWLEGARITGTLDLRFATGRGRCALNACRFMAKPRLEYATLAELRLENSHLPGLFAHGITVTGDLLLSGLVAKGTVDVTRARIGGQLSFKGADLDGTQADGKMGKALNAQGIDIGASLILQLLVAKGTVTIAGARIGGQLNCVGATLDGAGDNALSGQRMQVAQGFFFRDMKSVKGRVNLNSAHVGDLVDDLAAWPPGKDDLILHGFTYDRIGDAPTDASSRLPWLKAGSTFDGTFFPQPYTQLAKVLSEMGHERAARRILLEREALLAQDQLHKDQTRYRALRNGGSSGQGDIGWQ